MNHFLMLILCFSNNYWIGHVLNVFFFEPILTFTIIRFNTFFFIICNEFFKIYIFFINMFIWNGLRILDCFYWCILQISRILFFNLFFTIIMKSNLWELVELDLVICFEILILLTLCKLIWATLFFHYNIYLSVKHLCL